MANHLPARLGRNYLQKVSDRAALQEQRANQLQTENIHLKLQNASLLLALNEAKIEATHLQWALDWERGKR